MPDDSAEDLDVAHMGRALSLAAASTARVAPNPLVGAVVVDAGGRAVGGGTTTPDAHAETEALAAAGEAARAGTVYVTLEPCRHHGNTPPCTDALIAAGVARVVVAVLDPDPRVAGGGVALLRAAGIEVRTGVCEPQAKAQLAAYLHQRQSGRPLVVVKLAVTIDGRTAAPDGSSRWITGEASRADAHELRRRSDAVVVGAGTVLADDPRLTVRSLSSEADVTQPLRVVVDRRGRVPAAAALFAARGPVMVLTADASESVRGAWRDAGAVVEEAPTLDDVVARLGALGALQVMIEGGPTLAGAVLRAGLADRLVLYVGAALAGGDDATPALAGPASATIADFSRWRLENVTRFDDDVRLDYHPLS